MEYPKQTVSSVHDNEWYWARGKYKYMEHFGQWRAIQGKDIRMLAQNLQFEIEGPIEKPNRK